MKYKKKKIQQELTDRKNTVKVESHPQSVGFEDWPEGQESLRILFWWIFTKALF